MNKNLLTNRYVKYTLKGVIKQQKIIHLEMEDVEPYTEEFQVASEKEYELRQILGVFSAAKQLGMKITEDTTAAQLIEQRLGRSVDDIIKERNQSALASATHVTKSTASKVGEFTESALDKGFEAMGRFGRWLDKTSKR